MQTNEGFAEMPRQMDPVSFLLVDLQQQESDQDSKLNSEMF